METKAHYALIGFFVLALTAAGGVFLVWLSQTSFTQEFDEYEVVFEGPVRGLGPASDVRFNGIKVGEVVALRLDETDPANVIAQIRVDGVTPVKVDSIAQLEPQGITGLAYIQISAGGNTSPPPTPDAGQVFARIESEQAAFDQLFEGGQDVIQNASLALNGASSALSEQNVAQITETLENIRIFTDALRDNTHMLGEAASAVAELRKAAAEIEQAAVNFNTFAVDGRALLDAELIPVLRQTDIAGKDVAAAAEEFYALLDEVEPSLTRFAAGGLDDVGLAAGDLRRLIAVLERVALEVERDPSVFLSGSSRREVEIGP